MDRIAELEGFLSPEAVFSNPFEVVAAPGLGLREKRAILARWLARLCANEAALGLKWMPAASRDPAEFDDVMDALQAVEQRHHGQEHAGRSYEPGISSPHKSQKAAGTLH
jgi:hypothetical protein